jgi:hypothetical protein
MKTRISRQDELRRPVRWAVVEDGPVAPRRATMCRRGDDRSACTSGRRSADLEMAPVKSS